MSAVYALTNEELQVAIDTAYEQIDGLKGEAVKQSSLDHLNALRDIQLKRAELEVSEIQSTDDTTEPNRDLDAPEFEYITEGGPPKRFLWFNIG